MAGYQGCAKSATSLWCDVVHPEIQDYFDNWIERQEV